MYFFIQFTTWKEFPMPCVNEKKKEREKITRKKEKKEGKGAFRIRGESISVVVKVFPCARSRKLVNKALHSFPKYPSPSCPRILFPFPSCSPSKYKSRICRWKLGEKKHICWGLARRGCWRFRRWRWRRRWHHRRSWRSRRCPLGQRRHQRPGKMERAGEYRCGLHYQLELGNQFQFQMECRW